MRHRQPRDDSSISPWYVKHPTPPGRAVSAGTCAVVATRAYTSPGAGEPQALRLAMNMYAPERTRYRWRRRESGGPIDFSGGFMYYVLRAPQKPFIPPRLLFSHAWPASFLLLSLPLLLLLLAVSRSARHYGWLSVRSHASGGRRTA
ncbi:hypothetical protein HPB50_020151 [Hyalomma asiaticum]|uniref:Uncharacterized protein n=1 Tax=Hyalomma asiaticum TaxID=266040 RepID=A0ACB7TRS6_HYAAI|nr:hypothetical protein HPB50_020151 [Hyalomma asiaticum]